MNNERAIELLHRLQDEQFDGIHGDERREALEMAVKALEGDGDTISRQAAIEDVEEYADRLQMVDWKDNPGVPYKVHALNWCINTLRELPSAQLATDINVGDTISRQQAIDAVDVGKELLSCALDNMDIVGNDREKFEWGLGLIESYIDDIKDIPSAQPETHDKRTETHACDLINRQQAIDYCEALMNAERLQQTDDWGYGRERYNQTECIMHYIENIPSAQPELLEHEAYIRGFEQGRTQGMIDEQERKK